MDKYGQILINNSSKLDALTDACGEITKLATMIVEEQSKAATISLLKRFRELVDNPNTKIEVKRIAQIVNSSLIDFYGYSTIQGICNPMDKLDEDTRTLQDLLNELNALVGLEKVKNKVQDLIVYQKVQKMRREKNLHSSKNTLHLAFTGNPGTGKTTVARIVGRIYKQIGLLSKGHFVEVSRKDLIAGYQGQTALKVKKVIEQAKGGVLFIDEAYSITENDKSDSYGRECLTELTKALEDYREDLVVIVAGYIEPMSKFFESNPGLESRFNTFIEFDDYSPNELDSILDYMCNMNDYILDEKVKEKIHSYFEKKTTMKDKNFANARLVRNLYDNLIMNHARRVINIANPTSSELSMIQEQDFNFTILENENTSRSD